MASKRKFSPLWNHFTETEPKRAKCTHCYKILAISASSIGSLSRHMNTIHPTINIKAPRHEPMNLDTDAPAGPASAAFCRVAEVDESTATGDSLANQGSQHQQDQQQVTHPASSRNLMTVPVSARNNNRNSRPTPHTMADYVRKPLPLKKMQELDEQLVKMIAKGYHALRMVDEVEFRKFVEMLNPGYTLPTRKTLSESLLPKVYGKMVEAAREQLSKAKAICVTTDAWTSTNADGYIAITAHFINEDTDQICTVMIGCIEYQERHTAANLQDFFTEKFREWDIDGYVGVIVSDNAANMLAAIRLGNWSSIPCFAHTLNLVMQASLDSITDTVTRVKAVVQYFNRSAPGARKLKELQETMGIESLKLKQDVATRWNSTYDMIHRMSRMREAITFALALMRPDLSLDHTDWDVITKALPILHIFYEVTMEVCGENYVSASLYIVYNKLIQQKLEAYQNDAPFLSPITNLLDKLRSQMRQRFMDVESNTLLCEATILDPRFKKFGFIDILKYDSAASALRLKIGAVTLPAEEAGTSAPINAAPQTSNHYNQNISRRMGSTLWDTWDTDMSSQTPQNPVAAGIVEFDKYVQEPIVRRHENPLKWWKERRNVYPHLYTFMVKRLNITATSVPCERVFSKAGLTLNQRRTRLTTKKLSQLVFISSN
ncbi:E3 SUMO-protein ligase ZBED1-like [Cydia pomonella]|uniref:E3 SUMO-protein ligase ZBED1-like n=1 Tax=Cydia pomonella TaxID=82600 RepID=UPI002ADDB443|nr:E3 SUMO-protein ligase ZBED1-like [Cydia pomonella]